VLKTKEQTAQWVAIIRTGGAVPRLRRHDGANPAVFVNNLDWTAPMSALDFLRDVGKHFRVNQMVKKEAIAARLDSGGHLLHRVQLPAAAGAGLPPALP
jgi:tyrosyl-tRNA synthetase